MESIAYLIDSNVVIDYLGGVIPVEASTWLDERIDSEVAMSIITKIETLGFNPPDPADLVPFEEIVATVSVLHISDEIANKTIELRRIYKIKLPDALIAATALVFDLILLTRNTADFKKITSLRILDLHSMT